MKLHELVQFDDSAYRSASVQRGDVVVFHSTKHDLPLPSRVIGLPGDTLELRRGVLFVNGAQVPEPYIDREIAQEPYSRTLAEVRVPDGHVYLMGDFRDLSEDSRSIGTVSLDLVLGRIAIANSRKVET